MQLEKQTKQGGAILGLLETYAFVYTYRPFKIKFQLVLLDVQT